jgi:hypothetical protein
VIGLYELLGNPSTYLKTGRHDYHDDIAEILPKVALKHQKSNQNKSIRPKTFY